MCIAYTMDDIALRKKKKENFLIFAHSVSKIHCLNKKALIS